MKPSANQSYRVLLADDQADIRDALRLLLKREGYETHGAASPADALAAIESREFDAVLMDLNYARDTTSGQEGLDLLTRIQMLDSTLPVIVMTAWSSVEMAVEAMRRGARDFIQKPWENAGCCPFCERRLSLRQALRQASAAGSGKSPAARRVAARRSSPKSAAMQPVLDLIGAHRSVGRQRVDHRRARHRQGSRRADAARVVRASVEAMVTVNAGGLSEGVFESELFGHVKGAFTDAGRIAWGDSNWPTRGTLFLDEIANVPLNLQAKLLRVLETGELERVGSSRTRRVDVRVLSATNVDVNSEAAAGRFRQDLLFRLNTIEIFIPPLRERREDIDLLAHHFFHGYSQRYRKKISGFDPAATAALHEHLAGKCARTGPRGGARRVAVCRAAGARRRSGIARAAVHGVTRGWKR